MQDLKNLSNKKYLSRLTSIFSRKNSRKRLNTSVGDASLLAFITKEATGKIKQTASLKAIAVLFLLLVGIFCYKVPAIKNLRALLPYLDKSSDATTTNQADSRDFKSSLRQLGSAVAVNGSMVLQNPDGSGLNYSINAALQKRVYDFMAVNSVPYGLFIAVEPSTGRILAITSYSSVDRRWESSAAFETYPMASLFKIVTVAAALENKRITPDTMIDFRGNAHSENPDRWMPSRKGKNNRTDVSSAMGRSINPAYGVIAADLVGKELLMESVKKFGFNQTLFSDIPAKQSSAAEPNTDRELMLMGSGLDHDLKISPLHAVMMVAAIANGGKMMVPVLLDSSFNKKGTIKNILKPKELRQIVSQETAAALTKTLSKTVTDGTSHKAFHRKGAKRISGVDIAAKTGTIDGLNPSGHYSWFAGYAPMDNPKIAMLALVINSDKWKIKSSQVGAEAFIEFFDSHNKK